MAPPIRSMRRYDPPLSPVVHTPLVDDEAQSFERHVASPTHAHTNDSVGVMHHTNNARRASFAFINSASTSRPFRKYALRVDPLQDDRAVEIQLLTSARPHMRAFHYAWLSFFVAFVGWFSIPPLLPTIKAQLQLSSDQVANSNIAAVSSTIVGRIVIGPLCDRYGPRTIQAVLLMVGAVPVACAGLANNYTSFLVLRFMIGLVGCSFVSTTFWTSIMFSKNVVGTANALAAGWGNLGAGVTYAVTPLVFDLLTSDGVGVSHDLGWRLTLLFPACFMVVVGVLLIKYSDDSPHGNFAELRKAEKSFHGNASATATTTAGDVSLLKPSSVGVSIALWTAAQKPATWILAFQYACSFGVELQVQNVLSLYYYDDFLRADCIVANDPNTNCRLLTQTTASLIASLFGLMCIFARAMGGVASDWASRSFGIKGRILVQFTAFGGQAAALFVYAQTRTVSSSIPSLIVFGIFVQACTGTTYAIVPYVLPRYTGATSGIVGAGGNIGALCWGFLFKGVGDRALSFEYLSAFVAFAALLCAVTQIDGEGLLWRRRDTQTQSVVQRSGPSERLTADEYEFHIEAAGSKAESGWHRVARSPRRHQMQEP